MKFIKMLEEVIVNKECNVIENMNSIFALLEDTENDSQYELIIEGTNYPKWGMSIAVDNYINDCSETFYVKGPLNYYDMIFHYKIIKDEKSKEEYIVVIDRNEEFQLDKVISRKKVLSDEFKKVLLDFANDLKNERKYLEYILDNMASLKLDVLENFFELDEDGRKLIIETQ